MPAGDGGFPPYMVVLTEEEEDYYGSLLLVDMENGARKAGVPEPGTVAEIWRWSKTAPVAELLDSWEQKFRTLEWTVNPFNEECGMLLRYDRATEEHEFVQEVRQIYRDHGWPDDFRREECREALRKWDATIE
ncbi:hypothetical protein E4T44_00545 [Aureobasidium sp. EXF-8845]|nr:hypothetical protein E4T44_00545 [Aureobasidium sp. EXF-8845]KAI4857973.1 hypothetical protein E4T45_00518 [Aureobasidium sp. EXF-8846]